MRNLAFMETVVRTDCIICEALHIYSSHTLTMFNPDTRFRKAPWAVGQGVEEVKGVLTRLWKRRLDQPPRVLAEAGTSSLIAWGDLGSVLSEVQGEFKCGIKETMQ